MRLRKRIDPDEAYDLAKFERPGVIIIMGPVHAKEEWEKPLSMQDAWRINSLGANGNFRL
jgi:hypothetical protein